MAPSATTPGQDATSGEPVPSKQQTRTPLKLSGALEQFESRDLTAVIGTEFKNVQLVDWLSAPNSDEILRDLAITSEYKTSPRVSNREAKSISLPAQCCRFPKTGRT